jgi:hypothetical protein
MTNYQRMETRMARTKFTARGTLRLTTEQRSRIMLKAWKRRRKNGDAPASKSKKRANPTRSEAMLASWRRRRRQGKVPAKQKKVLMSHEQRSKIAVAAAKLRIAGEANRLREDRKLLNLPREASRAEIAHAFKRERRRLGLSRKSLRPIIRAALLAEQATLAARRRRRRLGKTKAAKATQTSPGSGAVISLDAARQAAAA